VPVLIADNDEAVSGLLVEVLRQSGISPEQAFNGLEALKRCQAGDLKVLICDLDMPGATGLEVLESLRGLEQAPQVVVISGYLDASIQQQLVGMPFVRETLRKPFDLMVFAATVRRLLGQAEHGVAPPEDPPAESGGRGRPGAGGADGCGEAGAGDSGSDGPL
jgi:two-component system nitrogen regulation response regulator GlnG